MSEEDRQKLLHQGMPRAFRVLSEIADDPKAKPRERAKAQKLLAQNIPNLRAACHDPSFSDEERREMEYLLKKLGG